MLFYYTQYNFEYWTIKCTNYLNYACLSINFILLQQWNIKEITQCEQISFSVHGFSFSDLKLGFGPSFFVLGSRVFGFSFSILGIQSRISGFRSRISDFRSRITGFDLGTRVFVLGSQVFNLRSRVFILGSRGFVLGSRGFVLGSPFSVKRNPHPCRLTEGSVARRFDSTK